MEADSVRVEELLDALAVWRLQNEAGVMVFVDAIGDFGVAVGIGVGVFLAGSAWAPTIIDPVVFNLLGPLSDNAASVEFVFTPQGSGGDWRIDNVYVDPFERG